MFHLLVKWGGWAGADRELAGDRLLEPGYTRPEVLATFKPNGILDVARAIEHPIALLASETGGPGDQNAHVVRLKNISQGMLPTSAQFTFEPIADIPTIPNSKVLKLAAALDLDPYLAKGHWKEMERNHWAIKDRDLFEVLFRDRVASAAISTQFLKFSEMVDPDLVAVMMPFDVGFTPVYDAIKAAVVSLGLKCERADTIWENHKVMDDITHLLSSASVVICDFSKQNSNVFYETGIAHAIGKNFIPITQSTADVPFDLRDHKYVHYYPNVEGLRALTASLQPRLGKLTKRPA